MYTYLFGHISVRICVDSLIMFSLVSSVYYVHMSVLYVMYVLCIYFFIMGIIDLI